MKKKYSLKLIAALVTSMAAMSSVQAADVSVDASVVVNNTINVTVDAALDFGTIAAFANDNTNAELASMIIPADPALVPSSTDGASGTARIIILSEGSPAELSVSGAAPNTALDITYTAADTAVTDPSGNATDGFTMGAFSYYATTEGNGQSFGTTTDGTGALAFNIGATLSTVTPANGAAADNAVAYTDATYTGTFEVTVNY